MSGEVNVIPTLREIRGGGSPSKFGGGASLETFSGEGQLKKPPCMIYRKIKIMILDIILNLEKCGVAVPQMH